MSLFIELKRRNVIRVAAAYENCRAYMMMLDLASSHPEAALSTPNKNMTLN